MHISVSLHWLVCAFLTHVVRNNSLLSLSNLSKDEIDEVCILGHLVGHAYWASWSFLGAAFLISDSWQYMCYLRTNCDGFEQVYIFLTSFLNQKPVYQVMRKLISHWKNLTFLMLKRYFVFNPIMLFYEMLCMWSQLFVHT